MKLYAFSCCCCYGVCDLSGCASFSTRPARLLVLILNTIPIAQSPLPLPLPSSIPVPFPHHIFVIIAWSIWQIQLAIAALAQRSRYSLFLYFSVSVSVSPSPLPSPHAPFRCLSVCWISQNLNLQKHIKFSFLLWIATTGARSSAELSWVELSWAELGWVELSWIDESSESGSVCSSKCHFQLREPMRLHKIYLHWAKRVAYNVMTICNLWKVIYLAMSIRPFVSLLQMHTSLSV